MKGIQVTANMLVIFVFAVLAIFVLLMLWLSFSAEAGRPSSEFFYRALDWLAGTFFR